MKRKKHAGGRPRVKIDLGELEKLCVLQCTQPEVAAFFGVSLRTVEDRAAKDQAFRETMERGYQKGKISVRRKQMQLLESGSQTMAIWLGKQLLGQRDNIDATVSNRDGTPLIPLAAFDAFIHGAPPNDETKA